MKKIYLTTVSALLLFTFSSAYAQTFNITTAGRNWTNTVGPGATFTGVIININVSGLTFTVDHAITCTNCTINAAGNASTYTVFSVAANLTLVNSTVNVTNFSQVHVTNNSALTLGNGTGAGGSTINLTTARIIIGTENSLADNSHIIINRNSVININSAYSNIRIGNKNNYIDANNNGNIQYTPPAPNNTLLASGTNLPINCGPGNPNVCAAGTVYGPALSNTTTFSVFSPLPVVLVDFKAFLNTNKTVGISWSTQQEVNADYFEVERSTDGINWQAIGTVHANVNSATVSSYAFVDQTPVDGANYYRLQSYDLDGKYGYTEIRVIRAALLRTFSVFPNPANSIVNVTITNKFRGSLRLYNLFGQLLLQRNVSADKDGTTISLPVHNFPAGHYMLQATQEDGTKQAEKIQIIR